MALAVRSSALTTTRRLGAGGEAEVWEVAERPGEAFKRYRTPTRERAEKLAVMVANPPVAAGGAGGHLAIAWPTELVVDSQGRLEGFLMPRIDLAASVPLFQVYNPQSRLRIAPAFTWRYLMRTARNVAAIIDALHRAGYVVGDLNESNLLVTSRALVALVDCDSMQVRDPATGVMHRGNMGKPEFTAPEFHGRDLSVTDRTVEGDRFALAVLISQLLLEGVHPFASVWSGSGEPPDIAARIRRGRFPYRHRFRRGPVVPPPLALPFDALPPKVERLARRTFTSGVRRPSTRPTAAEWAVVLEAAGESLRSCRRSEHHVYSGHSHSCPWCARIDVGLPDPFPGPTGRSDLRPTEPTAWQRRRIAAAARLDQLLRDLRSRATTRCRAFGRSPPLGGTLATESFRRALPGAIAVGAVAWWAPAVAAFVALVAIAPGRARGESVDSQSRRAVLRPTRLANALHRRELASVHGLTRSLPVAFAVGALAFTLFHAEPLAAARIALAAFAVAHSNSPPPAPPRGRLAPVWVTMWWCAAALAVVVAVIRPALGWPAG